MDELSVSLADFFYALLLNILFWRTRLCLISFPDSEKDLKGTDFTKSTN